MYTEKAYSGLPFRDYPFVRGKAFISQGTDKKPLITQEQQIMQYYNSKKTFVIFLCSNLLLFV